MADKKDVSLASLNVAQRILAVDARYNSLRLMAYPRQSALAADAVYCMQFIWSGRFCVLVASCYRCTPTAQCRDAVHQTTEPAAPGQRQPPRGTGCEGGVPTSPAPSFAEQVRSTAPSRRRQPCQLLAHQPKDQHGIAAHVPRGLVASVATETAFNQPFTWPGPHQVS